MKNTKFIQEEINKIESIIFSLREALQGEPLEKALQPLEERRENLITYLSSADAVAQQNSKAVGRQGVLIDGKVTGDIVTGIKADKVEIVYGTSDEASPMPDALSRYIENIIATHQFLYLQGIRAGSQPLSIPLEKVYISLGAIDSHGNSRNSTEKNSDGNFIETSIGYMSLPTALGRYRRLVIVGDPGCGKTTLISYLALTYARTLISEEADYVRERLGLDEPTTLPIVLPLREIAYHLDEGHPTSSRDGPSILLHYLMDYYASQQIILPKDFFVSFLENGNALLLLDGMDEVADSNLRQRVARLIEKFTIRFYKSRFVITSRTVGYEGASRVGADYGLARIREFQPHEVRQFVNDWTQAVEITLANSDANDILRMADEQAQKLIAAIESNMRVMELAVNPLLLTVIALVHRYRAQLPERRSELYEEAVEVLLGYWDEAKGLDTYIHIAGRELDAGDRRSLLEPVAFWLHEQQKREIERDVLTALLMPAFESMIPNPAASRKAVNAFINTINIRSGLLVERGVGIYSFAHLTFQEYLTARVLADRRDVLQYTLQRLADPWWREVFLLVAGYLSTQGKHRVSEFIRTIMDSKEVGGPEPFHNLLLAAECLFDIGPARVEGDLLGEVRTRLKQQADIPISQLGDHNAILTKILAVNAITRIESGYVVSNFWKLPYGEPEWVRIPAGTFWMGSDAFDDEKPIHELLIPEFQIARTPITNAQYAIYLNEMSARLPEHWRGQQIPAGLENHPIVNISWYEALDYCSWLAKKIHRPVALPSEAEWEKAARAGYKLYEYPWGKWAELHCNTEILGIGTTTPIGLFLNGASPYGVLDMSGNVWEWTRSILKSYPYDPTDGREIRQALIDGVKSSELRILRGGSFLDGKGGARCTLRFWDLPGNRQPHYGFRIVISSGAL